MPGITIVQALSASLLVGAAPSVHAPLSAAGSPDAASGGRPAAASRDKSLSAQRTSKPKTNAPTHSALPRPIDGGEFALLEQGAAAASISIDLPALGPVTIEVVRTAIVTDDFRLETAWVEGGKTVAQMAPVELPHAYVGRIRGAESSSVRLSSASTGVALASPSIVLIERTNKSATGDRLISMKATPRQGEVIGAARGYACGAAATPL
jgi:hypothetical protein